MLEAVGHGAGYGWVAGYECGFCVVEEVRAFEAVELLLEEGSVEVGESLFGGCGLGLVEEADAEEGSGEAVAADFFGAGGELVVVEGCGLSRGRELARRVSVWVTWMSSPVTVVRLAAMRALRSIAMAFQCEPRVKRTCWGCRRLVRRSPAARVSSPRMTSASAMFWRAG